jgi:predicted nuclease of predicted toxin-antitoxin system
MRILLDESVPSRLGRLLVGHTWSTVQREGWTSTGNGRLLALASARFDVLLTADKGMEHQQDQTSLPISILVVRAHSNRLEDLARAVPAVLAALEQMPPRTLVKVGG